MLIMMLSDKQLPPEKKNKLRLLWALFYAQWPFLLAVMHYIAFTHGLPVLFDISGASFPQDILLWTSLAQFSRAGRSISASLAFSMVMPQQAGLSPKKEFCFQPSPLSTFQVSYFLEKGRVTDDQGQLLGLGCSLKFDPNASQPL